MLCQNCNKNKANVKYTQIINGHKKEMMLCEECSEKLGINKMNFNMPIDFSVKPHTVIRVLMEYKPVEEYVEIPEQKLETPKREGFVAVEWGGTEVH